MQASVQQRAAMTFTLLNEFIFLIGLGLVMAVASHNCRNNLTLRRSNNTCDCVMSSADNFESCQNLSDVLVTHNQVIPEGDCLELNLEPGVYTLMGYTTSVNYSTVITAPRGGVNITCQPQCSETATLENVYSGSPLAFYKNNGTSQSSFVVLEGITFQDCPLPLQFDDLDNVTLRTSTFR